MQISTVLKIQGVHIQHYIFFKLLQYLDPWKCRVMWAEMDGCSRAPRSYKLLSVYSHYPPWDCFGQNALVHHIFLQSPMRAQDLRRKMNSTQITQIRVTDIDRPWMTRTDDRSFFPLDHGSLASSSGCYPQAAEQRATEKHWLWLIEHRHRHAQTYLLTSTLKTQKDLQWIMGYLERFRESIWPRQNHRQTMAKSCGHCKQLQYVAIEQNEKSRQTPSKPSMWPPLRQGLLCSALYLRQRPCHFVWLVDSCVNIY